MMTELGRMGNERGVMGMEGACGPLIRKEVAMVLRLKITCTCRAVSVSSYGSARPGLVQPIAHLHKVV